MISCDRGRTSRPLPAPDYSHHDLPCIHGQVSIVKTPVELLFGDRFIRWIMVRREVVVTQCVGCCYPLLGIKDQHALQQINRYLMSELYLGFS